VYCATKKFFLFDCYNHNRKKDFALDIVEHANNVAYTSIEIGKQLQLHYEDLQRLYEAALNHDIGKSKIPESILYKADKLSPEEWEIMKKHPVYSENIYLNMMDIDENTMGIARILRYHHENWDGTGYPDKLSGEEIPLHSRIIRIADVFDAITRPRVYRPFKIKNSLEIIKNMAGKEIDPYIFLQSYDILNGLLIDQLNQSSINWKEESILEA